jgi:hypothetical protein
LDAKWQQIGAMLSKMTERAHDLQVSGALTRRHPRPSILYSRCAAIHSSRCNAGSP